MAGRARAGRRWPGDRSGGAGGAAPGSVRRRRCVTTTRPCCARTPNAESRPWIRRSRSQHIADYALVVTSPGFQPTTPVLAAAAAAGVPDLGRRGAGLAAGRVGVLRAAAPLAGGDRHQRQDHHHVDAARHARSPRAAAACCAATSAARCSTCCTSPPTCWPSSCPASSCSGRRRCGPRPAWCSTSPKTTWTGIAPWPTTPPPRPGCCTGRVAVAGLDDSRAAALLDTAPAPVRVGFRLGEPARGGTRRARRPAGRPRVSPTTWRWLPAASIPVPGPVGRARRPGRGGAGPQRRGARRRDRGRAGVVPGWAGTGPRWWPSSTRSATSTTPRPPTRTPPRRRCWPTRGWCGSPVVCSRAHRCDADSRQNRVRGWSARC